MSQTVTGSAGALALSGTPTTTAPVDLEAATAASQVTLVQAPLNWIDLVRAKVRALFDGTQTVKSLHIDNVGQQASAAGSGQLVVFGNGSIGGDLGVAGDIGGAGKMRLDISSTPASYRIVGSLQTTNNSVLSALNFTVPTNKAIVVSGQIIGYKSDFTNAACFAFRNYGAKDSGGTLTQFSAGTVESQKDDATWGNCGPGVTGNIFYVSINGKTATTINWKVLIDITIV